MFQETLSYGDLVKPDAVHGSVYTDPAIFDDEMRRIYGRGWVYIGHESEAPNAGDFKRKTIGRQPVIFCRDNNGAMQVMFNRCRHRAASVCQLNRGNVKHFRCEYHGWTYALDGALTTVPYPDAYEELDKGKLSLSKPPHVENYRGFYFASMDAGSAPLKEQLGGPTLEQIDYFCDLSPEGEIELQAGAALLAYQGNWKLQMENTIDGYHPNFTHQSFFRAIARQTGERPNMFDGDSNSQCRALGGGNTLLDYRIYLDQPGKRDQTLDALKSSAWGAKYYDDMIAAHGKERAEDVILVNSTHMNVFPNLAILGQQVRTIKPISAERTEVELAPALLKGAPDELNAMRMRAFESFYSPQGGGIHDDIEMFNRVAEGLRCTMDPWLIFQRGLHREQVANDGTIAGNVTDEVSQRAMWRHWLEVMTADG
jgi:phenylpropionate dioxygenase-like ring-hydroxylating dioxygenase large terminal subunit